jgi:lipoprotein-releasing system ATP-binding protein
VIFGDEPTGNLDSTSSAEVIDMMREINLTTGTTFVLVTHDPDVAEACDRVIYMRDGMVTHDEAPAHMWEELACCAGDPGRPGREVAYVN